MARISEVLRVTVSESLALQGGEEVSPFMVLLHHEMAGTA